MKNIAKSLCCTVSEIREAEHRYGRVAGSVRLLAVTKTRPVQDVLEAIQAGQTEFAENYVQEAVEKIIAINEPGLTWHFIGPVQSNKARPIAEHFQWVHTVDRIKIAKRLNDARPDNYPPLNVCIQVNISGEDSKSGIKPDQVRELARAIASLPRLRLRGLMALPAPGNDFVQQRLPFAKLKKYLDEVRSINPEVDSLSMGTSSDMLAAIAEGATMVRIGTAIFGPRS